MENILRMDKDEQLNKIALRLEEFFAPDTPVGIQEMIFVAGMSVVGIKENPLSRADKMDVMHAGMCAVLEPMGYYRMTGRRDDGYPEYEALREISMEKNARGELLKDAIINYFADLLKD